MQYRLNKKKMHVLQTATFRISELDLRTRTAARLQLFAEKQGVCEITREKLNQRRLQLLLVAIPEDTGVLLCSSDSSCQTASLTRSLLSHRSATRSTLKHNCSFTTHLDLVVLHPKPIFSVFRCVQHLKPF